MSIGREESLFLTVSEDHRKRTYPEYVQKMSEPFERAGGMVEVYEGVVLGGADKFFGLDDAVIAGAVKGDIDVHGPVILDTSAIVMGNIKSKSVQINNGAVIEGMCSQCYAEVSPTSFFSDVKKNRK